MSKILGATKRIGTRTTAPEWFEKHYPSASCTGWLEDEKSRFESRAGFVALSTRSGGIRVVIFQYRNGDAVLDEYWALEYEYRAQEAEIRDDFGILFHYEMEDNK